MIKQYFKQSLVLLQQNKLLSVIAIIGTALAIAMIMCIVLIYQARTANYETGDKSRPYLIDRDDDCSEN